MPVPAAMERMSVEIVADGTPPPPRRGGALRVLWLAAAVLLPAALWARGLPSVVAWQVARDHERCFGRSRLPARVWSSDPAVVRDWLESRGTPAPPLPPRAHAADLVGARYCPLEDRVSAHVFYGGEAGTVSVFLLPGPARVGDGWSGTARGLHVRLLRAAGRLLAVVGETEADVEATARAFTSTVAGGPPPAGSPASGRSERASG
jgi:hypothetical protein